MEREGVIIGEAEPVDAQEISSLITLLAKEFILASSAAEVRAPFLQSISAGAIAEYLSSGNYRYHVAVHRSRIVGVVAVRDNKHLYHLFVATDYQNRGLATRLWEHAKRACEIHGNSVRYTVNTSVNALGFYEQLGFTSTGPPATKYGVTSTPMELVVRFERLQTHGPSAG